MLRALAIIMIVIAHTVYYVTTPALLHVIGTLFFYLVLFGLSLFFFISGFVLYYSHDGIETAADMLAFWKKRVTRIYPLYWLALISVFVLQTLNITKNLLDLSLSSILIQVSGLQSLLAPRFINPIYTVWFVGVILIFYLIYPLIAYRSRNGAHLVPRFVCSASAVCCNATCIRHNRFPILFVLWDICGRNTDEQIWSDV